MIRFVEKEKLEEMAFSTVSKDGEFSFDITIKYPEDVSDYHAHIYKKGLRGEKDEIGTFLLTKVPPRTGDDLEEFIKEKHKLGLRNISRADRDKIAKWAREKNKVWKLYSNWDTLILQYQNSLEK